MGVTTYISKLDKALKNRVRDIKGLFFTIPFFLYPIIPLHRTYAEHAVSFHNPKEIKIVIQGDYIKAARNGLWGVLESIGVKDSLPSLCRLMNEYNNLEGKDYLCFVNSNGKKVLRKGRDGIPDPILYPKQELTLPQKIVSMSNLKHLKPIINDKSNDKRKDYDNKKNRGITENIIGNAYMKGKTKGKVSSLENIIKEKPVYKTKTNKANKKSRFPFEIAGICLGLFGLAGLVKYIDTKRKRKQRLSELERGVFLHYSNLGENEKISDVIPQRVFDERYYKTMLEVISYSVDYDSNLKRLSKKFNLKRDYIKGLFSDYIASQIWARQRDLPSIRFRKVYFDELSWTTFLSELTELYYNPVKHGKYMSLKKVAERLEHRYGVKISVSSIIRYAKQGLSSKFSRGKEYRYWKLKTRHNKKIKKDKNYKIPKNR